MKLLKNAYIWQGDGFPQFRSEILIEHGRIVKLNAQESTSKPISAEVIDLNGAYVYPGFIDTHTHSFEGGLYSLGVDLSSAQSIEDACGLIESAYASSDLRDTLFAWQLDENTLKEKRFPSVKELDKICPDRPLIVRRIDGHSCIVNTAARMLLGTAIKPDELLRGMDNDSAVHFFHGKISPETILQAYHAASAIAAKGGFTGIHTMVGDAKNSIGHYALLNENLDKFGVEYTLYPQSFNLSAALEAGAKRIGGCILADGSIGSMTAALSETYLNSDSLGVLYQSDEFWEDFITSAHDNNMQVAVHCIGDRAISQINNIYYKLSQTKPKDLRHQLIHCELTDDTLLEEIAKSGAVPVMQPNFDLLWGGDEGFYSRKLGLERSRNMNRFGSFTRKGVRIAGGSDWYITALDAVMSILAAMNHHNPAERLTHAQAVNIYSYNAAWLSGDENRTGSVKEGYEANLTILNQPLNSDSLSSPETPDSQTPMVLITMRKGKVLYAKEG
ncbi:MAG: amidohydrolase [Candidatus Cloacimonetes bacterium]|nr:amidohydrolase [Candidatus Cloacimonadota bacterium]